MILTEDLVSQVINEIKAAEFVAFDTETVSIEDKTLVSFSIAYDTKIWFVPVKMSYFYNVTSKSCRALLNALASHKNLIVHLYYYR